MGDKTLSEVAQITMGQSPKGDTYNQTAQGVPLLNGPTEFGPYHPYPKTWTTSPTKLCKLGEILFCVRGSTTGRMNWSDQEYCLGRGLASFSAKSGRQEDTKFLYYLLNYELPALLGLSAGSVFPNLSSKDFSGFKIYWPPQDIRYAIAEYLGSLDDKIEHNRQMNHTLEFLARAIFKSWFVDFDPVLAKMEGRQPIGMDAEIAALFPDGFEESALGEIPRGWQVGKIGDIGQNVRRSIKPEEIPPETPYIGLEHMPRRSIALSEWGKAGEVVSNKFQFQKGEILFGKLRPYFHKVGVAILDGVCSTDVLVVSSQKHDDFGLLLGHLSSTKFINYVDAGSEGTKMPRSNWDVMSRYGIAMPPQELSAVYTEKVEPMLAKIRMNIEESRTLAALRDMLLPRLMSGEVRVKDVI